MPNKQQKLTDFDSIDSNDGSDYAHPWQCPRCESVYSSVQRPDHIRDCDGWGGGR